MRVGYRRLGLGAVALHVGTVRRLRRGPARPASAAGARRRRPGEGRSTATSVSPASSVLVGLLAGAIPLDVGEHEVDEGPADHDPEDEQPPLELGVHAGRLARTTVGGIGRSIGTVRAAGLDAARRGGPIAPDPATLGPP